MFKLKWLSVLLVCHQYTTIACINKMKCERQLLQNTLVMIIQKKGQTKTTVHPVHT